MTGRVTPHATRHDSVAPVGPPLLPEHVSLVEAAQALGLSPRTLEGWCFTGSPEWKALGARKLGNRWRFEVAKLQEFYRRAPQAMGLTRPGARRRAS